MRHRTPVAVALTVAILWPGVSAAGPMLTGSVTYDPNYELYSTAATRSPLNLPSGFVESGRVVAQDLTNVPEPTALAIAVIGLVAVGFSRSRRGIRSSDRVHGTHLGRDTITSESDHRTC